MATRLYLMPMTTVSNRRFPKYMASPSNTTGVRAPWSATPFGYEPLALVSADVTTAQNTTLTSNADVLAVPANLSSSPNQAAVTNLQTYLESANVPADWIVTTLTYAQMCKRIGVIFQLAQRLHGIFGNARLFDGTVTLSTTLAGLPANARQALLESAASFGWDTSTLTGTTTVREALKFTIQAWGAAPMEMLGVTL